MRSSCALLLLVALASAYPKKDVLFADVGEPRVTDIAGDDEGGDKVTYWGAQLWKVAVDTQQRRAVIAKLRDNQEISPWGGNTTSIDIMIHQPYLEHVAVTLKEANIPHELLIPDIQRAIIIENPPVSDDDELTNRNGHKMTWSAYHRLSDIHGYLDHLASTYPSLITVKTIGSSHQGRPLKLLKLSNGNIGNKAVWIDGGVHAREWISPATVTYLINQFVENYESESEDVKNIDWYFLPVVNPDGYEYSHTRDRLWRKNRAAGGRCQGTDLNRNFGYKWGGRGSSKNQCTEIFGGSAAFSEPETQAIKNFILNSGINFKAYLSFHSYGQYILYPWGYDRYVPPDHQDLQRVAQKAAQIQLKETKKILKENEITSNKQACRIQDELDETIEELKDTKEQNTALQLQLNNLTKTHQELKANYEELLQSKKNLELRINEIDTNFTKCRSELIYVKDNNDKLHESESNLKKLLEIERLQSKTARLQNEKDAKCIQDLNRQVKEMERIISRKQPDSVSSLVTSKNDDSNFAARTLLENRIKQLEAEATMREKQSTNVFSEIQEKFNQMKSKYESHIEDLEIHVNDLKTQLRTKADTYDIYTQTYTEEVVKVIEIEKPEIENKKEIIETKKETFTVSTQTDTKTTKAPVRKPDKNEDAHLLATIRGLQTDLTNKEKLLNKLNKELEELRKTNRKLQKDRESNLKLAVDNKSRIVDKIITKSPEPIAVPIHKSEAIEKDIKIILEERDKLKSQLNQLEDEYQNLKTKRLQDLNILQEAHEREITTYMSNIGPMREQLDVQQLSISNLQQQLATAKEELAIITVERDHLDARLKNIMVMEAEKTPEDATTQLSLQKKIAFLERRYEEREHRLRTIVHSLAQKQVTTKGCEQCAIRQQQLIGYKAELDQIIATLRCEEYKRRNSSTDISGIEEYMVVDPSTQHSII